MVDHQLQTLMVIRFVPSLEKHVPGFRVHEVTLCRIEPHGIIISIKIQAPVVERCPAHHVKTIEFLAGQPGEFVRVKPSSLKLSWVVTPARTRFVHAPSGRGALVTILTTPPVAPTP